jgi:D-glycero-D-manno-heptose 1,7-bisphosphate phosphatase
MKALFLDRDGTLIVDKVYLSDPEGVELYPGVIEGLKKARTLGYRLFLFTNQSGIGRGYYTQAQALAVNERFEQMLGLERPVFDGICMAPEAPGQPSLYRKPSPRFILEMIAKHGLDPAGCIMVGDAAADIGAALAAGIRAAAVRTGKVDPLTLPIVTEKGIPVYDTFSDFARKLEG